MHLRRSAQEESRFRAQLEHYAEPVLDLCRFTVALEDYHNFPNRDYLSRLRGRTTRLQELLDHHGAQHNERWFPLREAVAAGKLFSTVTYAVLHIRMSLGRYRLFDIDQRCDAKTDAVLDLLRAALTNVSQGILAQAERCGIPGTTGASEFVPWVDPEVEFELKPDRSVRHSDRVGEVVVHLATSFLNLSEDRDVRTVLADHECPKCAELVPDPINEEILRTVETRFHNLQSMYDTYIFESDVERQNDDLRYLRGHISIIYHLTEIATHLIHYYVRHMSALRRESGADFRYPMNEEKLLGLVFGYPIRFSRLYLESAVQLCQKMIRSYSVPTEIEVPIPSYRGFHVRPSTLVAKIVFHYGSEVTMRLNGRSYDASQPLELFRANEEINALKRRAIANLLNRDPELARPVPADPETRMRDIRLLVMELVHQDRIILYDTDLDLDPEAEVPESTVAEYAIRVVRHLVSVAKMDVRADLTVTFAGDNRPLKDLEILARNGYGEDRMGNNIVLPDALSYLSR